jgi:hypothetical protein
MYFMAERWNHFAVDSRNKTGQNGSAIKPSQDGEEKIIENSANNVGNWRLAASYWPLATGLQTCTWQALPQSFDQRLQFSSSEQGKMLSETLDLPRTTPG